MISFELIDINDTVYNICSRYPKLKEALYELGFNNIKNPIMFNTAAKVITLKGALKFKKINFNKLKHKFNEYGFDLKKYSISNSDERNDILKSLIVKLHNGGDIDLIKREFEGKLIKVSAEEVHNAMHELVNDGMSIDEAKHFFYIRTLILKDAMDNSNIEYDYEAVVLFKNENRYIEDLLNNKILSSELYDKLHEHYSKKESLFFTALKKYGNDEPSKVMSKVDRDILNELNLIIKNNDFEGMKDFKNNIYDMIFKEENILLPLCASVFSKEDFDNIAEYYKANN
ncbi:DUF438 domain-containing protein [Brachyspira alvinipulli]|uniref:DUF438 domain-containing protein n=1 Tax=Brachyspira alvinipulli TaxID=84379 RepID=UPI000487BFDE|nr:DUF438 domain-containing protein [Brachyspira alvinipulli]